MNIIDDNAKRVWDYMLLEHELKLCDAIFVLGSRDDRVAEYAAQLFLDGYGKWLIISGGAGPRNTKVLDQWDATTEAEHFGNIARQMGVPDDRLLLETEALNTGDNIENTQRLLSERELAFSSLLLVQKPYMERRTFATIAKQWQGPLPELVVSSPPIAFSDYCVGDQPKDVVINVMVGDMQRILEYPKQGFQIEQDIPADVWQAYEALVAAGYDQYVI
ncbi:MAG: YdcF family protein [Gammaproteobacteria bacterium]|nr:YdcF family protein [Gammaproteobacteria bacterium]